jgi:hypothetical protein
LVDRYHGAKAMCPMDNGIANFVIHRSTSLFTGHFDHAGVFLPHLVIGHLSHTFNANNNKLIKRIFSMRLICGIGIV